MPSRARIARNLGLAAASALAAASPWVAPDGTPGFGPGRALGQVPAAFAREPRNPLETWEVADYLIRTGQPAQAAPYVKRFVESNPDDATLLQVQQEAGTGSILRLSDDPSTAPYAAPLAKLLAAASIRTSTDPARLDRYVSALTRSREEQAYAIARLREAGPYGVPPILRELERPGLPDDERIPFAEALEQLDRSAVPPLIATLDSPDAKLVGDAARALGRIGDPRAVPALTYLAARKGEPTPAISQVLDAIEAITGKGFTSQAKAPVRVMADEARRYVLHLVRFPGPAVVLWTWDPSARTPIPRIFSSRDAEGLLGIRAAQEALAIDPADLESQVSLVSLLLDHNRPDAANTAMASGPKVLGQALRTAIADGRGDLAVAIVPLLGQVVDRDDLATGGDPDPIVEAVSSPDRRVQFAAAEALVKLDPRKPFSGSSRVVPVLGRFVSTQAIPRALVVDGNIQRGGQVASFLRPLGYDVRQVATGASAFDLAAISADFDLILVDPNFVDDPWKLPDFLGNLKADGRTAGIPVVVVGPLRYRDELASSLESFPSVRFAVTPTDPNTFAPQLARAIQSTGVRPLTADERSDYARRAASLLATIARRPGSPFEADLPAAERPLAVALGNQVVPAEAAAVLGDIPGHEAQQTLADAATDASRPAAGRVASAEALARNIRRYGRHLTDDQERTILREFNDEQEPALRANLAAVIGALRPTPDASGQRLQVYRPLPPAR